MQIYLGAKLLELFLFGKKYFVILLLQQNKFYDYFTLSIKSFNKLKFHIDSSIYLILIKTLETINF